MNINCQNCGRLNMVATGGKFTCEHCGSLIKITRKTKKDDGQSKKIRRRKRYAARFPVREAKALCDFYTSITCEPSFSQHAKLGELQAKYLAAVERLKKKAKVKK